jgi:uncharacterized RDD family membrane protein YckC
MQYEDRLSIPTPEGVDLELTLGGVGSRFVASLLDQVIQWTVIFALMLLLGRLGGGGAFDVADSTAAALAMAALVVAVFVVQLLYDVSFETLASGRTPGKRWTGLRVVRLDGSPVGFVTSAVRNLLRIVDVLPGFYAVGLVAVLASRRNQRLGDLAAGTLVVRERGARRRPPPRPPPAPPTHDWTTWDVSSVTAGELATVRRFLDRRHTLTAEARRRLAEELARRLRAKVVHPEGGPERPEEFLEELAAAKAART